jgi:hypothetical protein
VVSAAAMRLEKMPAGVVSADRSVRTGQNHMKLHDRAPASVSGGMEGCAAMCMPSERPSKSWWNDITVALRGFGSQHSRRARG